MNDPDRGRERDRERERERDRDRDRKIKIKIPEQTNYLLSFHQFSNMQVSIIQSRVIK